MKNFVLVIGILAVICVQCKNQKTITMTQSVREIINTNTFISQVSEPDFTISNARLDGDILKLTVQFSGEKGKHDFDLLWDGAMMKSMPPKVILTPVHKSENASGRKTVDMQLEFNISLIGKGGHSSVVVMLKDYPENLMWERK